MEKLPSTDWHVVLVLAVVVRVVAPIAHVGVVQYLQFGLVSQIQPLARSLVRSSERYIIQVPSFFLSLSF